MTTASVTLSVRALRALVILAAAGLLLTGWWAAQARAGHDPDHTLHACAAANGNLRLAESCRSNETPLVLATGDGLQTAADRSAALEARVATLEETVTAQEAAIGDLRTQVATRDARIEALEAHAAGLEALLAGVSRGEDDFGRDTLRFEGMNLQLVNGTGSTDGDPNGLGNLVIGYNAIRSFPVDTPADDRAGSHYLVVGDGHHWTRFGGILAGRENTASGDWASVTGGLRNTASGPQASVTGGASNTASGFAASVTGGVLGVAEGVGAWVSGGIGNTATGARASISGGADNRAAGLDSSVSGGQLNAVSGDRASLLGGLRIEVTDELACHPACN